MQGWLNNIKDVEGSRIYGDKIKHLLFRMFHHSKNGNPLLREISEMSKLFSKKSFWVILGDGAAYDIGFGGIDHVLATGENINVLILDTEVYSNTGGQSSKATPTGSVAKFAASGKKTCKKNIGRMFRSYEYVYVAKVSMGANKQQLIKAFIEAESYDGPSLIMAYAPCINHGIMKGMGKSQEEAKRAVECGYWPLYRYSPMLKNEGKNPLKLDSKDPNGKLREFLSGEVRFSSLEKTFPEEAERLFARLEEELIGRYETMKNLANADWYKKG